MLRSHVPPSCPHSSSELPCQPCHSPVPISLPLPPPLPMPARRDRIAPIFNSHAPRTLPKYFSDLEFFFLRSHVTTDTEKKYHATRFLELDEQELWECVPEFTNPTASFQQFTAAIFHLYPDADPDRRYSLADLEALVTELTHIHSLSRARFLEFYRRFFAISSFLRSRDRLSSHEQSRTFIRAIPSHIWQLARQRLEIKCPDVHPNDTYALRDLRDAVDFVLLTSCTATQLISAPPVSSLELPVPAPIDPSLATLADAVNELKRLVSSHQPLLAASRPDPQLPASPRPVLCSYCSNPTHFIAHCPAVAADIRSGICKRNAEGKVVLPSGFFVPHCVVGPNLRARIVSWHATNPACMASPIASRGSAPAPSTPYTPIPHPYKSPLTAPHSSRLAPTPRTASVSTFSTEGRIIELESQLAALRSHAHPIAVNSLASCSPSPPFQPVSHGPPLSHVDLTSVYVQQQQNVEKIDTHGFPAPPFAPAAPHHIRTSQIASKSDFAPVSSPEKSSLPRHVYPLSRAPQTAPQAVSPQFPREQSSQLSHIEPVHVPELQGRVVSLDKSFPVFHANSEFLERCAVPRAVSPLISCEQEPQLSPIEPCRISEAQGHLAQSQIPFRADSEFLQSH